MCWVLVAKLIYFTTSLAFFLPPPPPQAGRRLLLLFFDGKDVQAGRMDLWRGISEAGRISGG
jgi:hypothetical protein